MRSGVRATFGRYGDRAETPLARAGRCVHSAGSGTGHDNRATYPGSDYADTDRRTDCHRDAHANPHSTSYRDANTVSNCYADTNAHSRTVVPL